MSWYGEQIKKPQWQKKRLEILNRDEWKCTLCNDKDEELHIHHKKYKGKPWEALSDDLTTVCKKCHSVIEIYCPLHKVEFLESINLTKCGDIMAFNSEKLTFLFSIPDNRPPEIICVFIRGGSVLSKMTEFNKL